MTTPNPHRWRQLIDQEIDRAGTVVDHLAIAGTVVAQLDDTERHDLLVRLVASEVGATMNARLRRAMNTTPTPPPLPAPRSAGTTGQPSTPAKPKVGPSVSARQLQGRATISDAHRNAVLALLDQRIPKAGSTGLAVKLREATLADIDQAIEQRRTMIAGARRHLAQFEAIRSLMVAAGVDRVDMLDERRIAVTVAELENAA